uniref:DUF4378 domain-containing protein n=1 Tax=Macrostomum lignano TaxID=282301 RepID=A0A1I8JPM1_9PLAT
RLRQPRSSRRRVRQSALSGRPAVERKRDQSRMACCPFRPELQKLRSCAGRPPLLCRNATAASNLGRRNKIEATTFEKARVTTAQKDTGELVEETTLTENRTVAACSSTASFRTDTATSSAPNANIQLRSDGRNCSETSHCTEVSHHHKQDSGTPTRSTTSNSKRQVRSEISFSSSKIRSRHGSEYLKRKCSPLFLVPTLSGLNSHRHKHVTFGKVANRGCQGTAMIGDDRCASVHHSRGHWSTRHSGLRPRQPVLLRGGKKLVKKIRRQVRKKEELECTDRLTREDILVWLENCEGEPGFHFKDCCTS